MQKYPRRTSEGQHEITSRTHALFSWQCIHSLSWLKSSSSYFMQVDIPNIQKQRKHLAKLVLDMDSARTRWSPRPHSCSVQELRSGDKEPIKCNGFVFLLPCAHRFQQSSKSSSHPSTLQPGAKSESLREEMEEAANRMEICRVSRQSEALQYYSIPIFCSFAPDLIYISPARIGHKRSTRPRWYYNNM